MFGRQAGGDVEQGGGPAGDLDHTAAMRHLEDPRELLQPIELGDAHQISIEAVVEAVGCTPPALYYFPSKERLLLEVCRRQYQRFAEALEGQIPSGANAIDQLAARGHAYLDRAAGTSPMDHGDPAGSTTGPTMRRDEWLYPSSPTGSTVWSRPLAEPRNRRASSMQPRIRPHPAGRRRVARPGRQQASVNQHGNAHWGWLDAGVVALLVALAALAPTTAFAAVEPGIYFDPERADAGDRVTLFSAADYVVCFSLDAGPAAKDWPVHLAAARIEDPVADDLVLLRGTWSSESDGAVSFSFTVPEVEPGPYRGYIECADGSLDPSTTNLTVAKSPPATDSGPFADGASAGSRWLVAVVAGLGGLMVALRRLSRTRAVTGRSSPSRPRPLVQPDTGGCA